MSDATIEVETFDFIERINAAKSIHDVYQLLAVELRKFGFTDFLITDMPPPDRGLQGHTILNGWSQAWFERYMQEDFYSADPMARHTHATVEPFFWNEVNVDQDDLQALRVMNEVSEFGLKEGFSVPILGAEGDLSCVTMGGRRMERQPRMRTAIHMMSIYAHARARALASDRAEKTVSAPPNLSEREREVLKWVARGKTDWEIGEILNISKETSFAHVRNCCRKLDAQTRTQAAVRAILLGQILP